MSITINNLVILGTAVPEMLKDGRKTVCVAAWSNDLGFVRVYPCNAEMGLHRWDIITVTVEGNNRDSRFESWKITQEGQSVVKTGKLDVSDRRALLESTVSSCVLDINDSKLSLGIIQAHSITPELTKNRQPNNQEIFSEFTNNSRWLKTKSDYPVIPKIKFNCGDKCRSKKGHNQTVLEWGAYEWARKNPTNIQQVFDNWKLNSSEYDIFFVIGNLYQHRNSFIIISVIPLKQSSNTNHLLFDLPQVTTKDKQHSLQKRIGLAMNRNEGGQ